MTSDATGVVDTIRDIAANEGGGALYAGSTALRTTFTTHESTTRYYYMQAARYVRLTTH